MAEMVEENCDKEEICKIIDQKDENEVKEVSDKKQKRIDEKIEYEGWEKWERDDIIQEALMFFAEVQKESVEIKYGAFKKFLAIVKQYCKIKKNHRPILRQVLCADLFAWDEIRKSYAETSQNYGFIYSDMILLFSDHLIEDPLFFKYCELYFQYLKEKLKVKQKSVIDKTAMHCIGIFVKKSDDVDKAFEKVKPILDEINQGFEKQDLKVLLEMKGILYFKHQKYSEAAKVFKKLTRLQNEEDKINEFETIPNNFCLALTHEKLDNQPEACKIYRKIVECPYENVTPLPTVFHFWGKLIYRSLYSVGRMKFASKEYSFSHLALQEFCSAYENQPKWMKDDPKTIEPKPAEKTGFDKFYENYWFLMTFFVSLLIWCCVPGFRWAWTPFARRRINDMEKEPPAPDENQIRLEMWLELFDLGDNKDIYDEAKRMILFIDNQISSIDIHRIPKDFRERVRKIEYERITNTTINDDDTNDSEEKRESAENAKESSNVNSLANLNEVIRLKSNTYDEIEYYKLFLKRGAIYLETEKYKEALEDFDKYFWVDEIDRIRPVKRVIADKLAAAVDDLPKYFKSMEKQATNDYAQELFEFYDSLWKDFKGIPGWYNAFFFIKMYLGLCYFSSQSYVASIEKSSEALTITESINFNKEYKKGPWIYLIKRNLGNCNMKLSYYCDYIRIPGNPRHSTFLRKAQKYWNYCIKTIPLQNNEDVYNQAAMIDANVQCEICLGNLEKAYKILMKTSGIFNKMSQYDDTDLNGQYLPYTQSFYAHWILCAVLYPHHHDAYIENLFKVRGASMKNFITFRIFKGLYQLSLPQVRLRFFHEMTHNWEDIPNFKNKKGEKKVFRIYKNTSYICFHVKNAFVIETLKKHGAKTKLDDCDQD